MAPSSTASAAYSIAAAQVAAPRFSPAAGPFSIARPVTVTCVTTGAVIHYTTDGAVDPTPSDPTVASGGTIDVDRSMTLKATAWLDGTPSAVGEGSYHVTGAVAAGGDCDASRRRLALADGHVWAWGRTPTGSSATGPHPAARAGGGPGLRRRATLRRRGRRGGLRCTRSRSRRTATSGHGATTTTASSATARTTSSPVVYPVAVKRQSASGPALDGVVALAAGQSHNVALRSDGTVWAWGQNTYGALGDGTTDQQALRRLRPQGIRRPASGRRRRDRRGLAATRHSLALRSDGTVWGWGYGQAVDGSTSEYTRAIQIAGVSDLVGIAAGDQFSAAVRVDGTVWAWGLTVTASSGTGPRSPASARSEPLNLTRAAQVDVGPAGEHVVALVPGAAGDQTVWAWGDGAGPLGDSSTGGYFDRLSPAQVSGMVDVVAAAAGGRHTLALLGDATVLDMGRVQGGRSGATSASPTCNRFPARPDPVTAGQTSSSATRPGSSPTPTATGCRRASSGAWVPTP